MEQYKVEILLIEDNPDEAALAVRSLKKIMSQTTW